MSKATMPVLHKPTATIQISNPFTLYERKLLNTFMYYSQKNGSISDSEHDIPLSAVLEAVGWGDSKNLNHLKDCIRSLLSTVIEWNEFGEDRSAIWSACQFLSSGSISRGRVRFMINPKIVKELSRPTLYAKVQLLVQSRLTKKHSLVLYEYFQDKLGRNRRINDVPIQDLLDLLHLNGETYLQWKYFKRDILKPIVAEINRYTDLSVTFTGVRNGNRTNAVDFVVERVAGFQLSLDMQDLDIDGASSIDSLAQKLIDQGVLEQAALTLVGRYDARRIEASLEAFDAAKAANPKSIENPGAWLRKAIESNWHAPREEPSKEASAQRSVLNAEEEERLRARYHEARSEAAWEAFEEKSKNFQTRRRNAFTKLMENPSPELRWVAKHFKGSGFRTAIVRGHFMNDKLMNELLKDSPLSDYESFKAHELAACEA